MMFETSERTRKKYLEKLMNEENEWDHRILAGVKEGPTNREDAMDRNRWRK